MKITDDTQLSLIKPVAEGADLRALYQWDGRRVPHALCQFQNLNCMFLLRLAIDGYEPVEIRAGDVIDGVERILTKVEAGKLTLTRATFVNGIATWLRRESPEQAAYAEAMMTATNSAGTHPGIQLRILTPDGPLANQDSDALHCIAQFGRGASCDPACLPSCDKHGWLELFPGENMAWNGSRDLVIQVRAVDLPDSLPED